jgi:hypothetical protein
MFINIYKNWLNDVHVNTLESMKRFMEMKKTLVDESEDVIDKIGLLELEENDNMLYVIFLIFFHFVKK